MVLNSLGLDKTIEINTENTQEEIIEYITRKKFLLQRFKN
jgi:hypothetical protein